MRKEAIKAYRRASALRIAIAVRLKPISEQRPQFSTHHSGLDSHIIKSAKTLCIMDIRSCAEDVREKDDV